MTKLKLPSRPRTYRVYDCICFQSGIINPFLQTTDDSYYSSEDVHTTLHTHIQSISQRRTDNIPMSLVNDIVKYAVWLLGGRSFYDLLILQCDNGQLRDYTRDFLVDTITMLSTGSRQMSTHTWLRLATATPAEYVSAKKGPISDHALYDALKATLPTNPIATWLAMDGGLEDLLTSLYILFAQANFDPWQCTPNRV